MRNIREFLPQKNQTRDAKKSSSGTEEIPNFRFGWDFLVPSDPTPSNYPRDPEFPPGDPQESQDVQILTPTMEETRSKAKISQFFNKEWSFPENSHPDPGLCSHSKLRKTQGHPGISAPNQFPLGMRCLFQASQTSPNFWSSQKTSQPRNGFQSHGNCGIRSPG